MIAYAVFGILVTIVFILAPPRWPSHCPIGKRRATDSVNKS